MIDYENSARIFREYVQNYDPQNGKIRLKLVHTFHVVSLSERIARDLGCEEEDVQLAKLIGLLHDIGRFEQAKRFNTFVDKDSVDHAALGVKILEENHFIDSFCTGKEQEIVLRAVANHNRFAIEEGLDERTRLQAEIIRDADKTDIFRVRTEDPVEDAFPYSQAVIENSTISPSIYESFMRSQQIDKNQRQTPMDMWVGGLAFIFDYNFSCSLRILEENRAVDRQIDRITYRHEETAKQMEAIRAHAHAFIKERIAHEDHN
jgi:putative nucleotidyltransferase with HDIG domain